MLLQPGDVVLYQSYFEQFQHTAIAIDATAVVHADGPHAGEPGFVRCETMEATQRYCGMTFADQRLSAIVYRCRNGLLAQTAAEYARRFGRDNISADGATQYGENRARGVNLATTPGSDGEDLPFEFDATYRAFKWACGGGKGDDQFSKNQGTTCAAFVIACYQAAAIRTITDDVGSIETCLEVLRGLRVDKKSTKQERWQEKTVKSSKQGEIKRTDAYSMKVSNVGVQPQIEFAAGRSSTYVAEYAWEMVHEILKADEPVRLPEYYMTKAMKVDAKFCYTATLARRLRDDGNHWKRRTYDW